MLCCFCDVIGVWDVMGVWVVMGVLVVEWDVALQLKGGKSNPPRESRKIMLLYGRGVGAGGEDNGWGNRPSFIIMNVLVQIALVLGVRPPGTHGKVTA